MTKHFLMFFVAILFISCGKDEDAKCTVDQFVGKWTFKDSKACILDDTNLLTITKIDDTTIYGEYTGAGVTSTFTNWTVNNCTFTGKVFLSGFIDVTVTGTLDGNNLSILNVGTYLGTNVNCTEKLVK